MRNEKTKQILEQIVEDLREQHLVSSSTQRNKSFLLAADGTYLGAITHARDTDSLLNRNGPYGSTKSYSSIYNNSSVYGNSNGEFSPYNPDCQDPPLLFISGEYWGRVAISDVSDSKVLPTDKFVHILETDWTKFERDEFSDSGSIRIPAGV